MRLEWVPIHANHAIDVMAAVVAFAQPLPDRLFARFCVEADKVALSAKLDSRHLTSSMNVPLSTIGDTAPLPPSKMGRIYNSIREDFGGDIQSAVSEQLEIDHQTIIYRTFQYVSWEWQSKRIHTLMEPLINLVGDVVEVSMVRMEYMDRFRSVGTPETANAQSLLDASSRLLPPHIFDNNRMWHAHTGGYLPPVEGTQSLFQAHLEAADGSYMEGEESRLTKWVNILTAREDRPQVRDEFEERDLSKEIFETMDRQHSDLKEILASLLVQQMSDAIYLKV